MDWLNKKYGKLPVWAWGLIAAVVLYVGWRFLSNRGSSSGGKSPLGGSQLNGSGNGSGGGDTPDNPTAPPDMGNSGDGDVTEVPDPTARNGEPIGTEIPYQPGLPHTKPKKQRTKKIKRSIIGKRIGTGRKKKNGRKVVANNTPRKPKGRTVQNQSPPPVHLVKPKVRVRPVEEPKSEKKRRTTIRPKVGVHGRG